MSPVPGRPALSLGGTNAVNTSQPVFVGSIAAIAAARAGQEVMVSRVVLDDGTQALRVVLPAAHQPARGGPGPRRDERREWFSPRASHAAAPRRFVEEVSARPHRRPPVLTSGQKTLVIAGSVVVGVLLALTALLWVLTVLAAAVAAYSAIILVVGAGIVIVWGLCSGGGGGGSTNVVNIAAKKIGRITFK